MKTVPETSQNDSIQRSVSHNHQSQRPEGDASVDILLGSPLPLHPPLLGHKRLSIALKADGEVCGETNVTTGNPETGMWEINSTLAIPKIKQRLTVAVVAHEGRIKIQLASAMFSVSELLSRVETLPDGHHDFIIGDFRSVLFLITCLADSTGASTTGIPFTSPSNSILAMQTHRLGREQQQRFNNSGDIGDLESAIRLYHNALTLVNYGDPGRLSVLSSLGTALRRRFESIRDISDVHQAISLQQQAVELTPEEHPERAARLGNLGNALITRYDLLSNPADFEHGISYLREASELLPMDGYNRPNSISNIGCMFLKRFQHTGALTDLNNGIENLRKALELAPEDKPIWPTIASNYVTMLMARVERIGGHADIEDAISVMQKAVALTPEGHPAQGGRSCDLGVALWQRFQCTGNAADINNTIHHLQKAVDLTPEHHPGLPRVLCHLGGALEERFDNTGNLVDINDAISKLQKAVALTPDNHPSNWTRLSNLGACLQARFHHLGSLYDIENAILALQKAGELAPRTHPQKPALLNNLGNALRSRFEKLGRTLDLDNAISNLRMAVELIPEDHKDRPRLLGNLGVALQRQMDLKEHTIMMPLAQAMAEVLPGIRPIYDMLNDPRAPLKDLKDLPSILKVSLHAAYTSALGNQAELDRLSARALADIANDNSRSPIPAFSCVINLLPQIAWLGLEVSDQHALLADFGGLVRNAVAAAIKWQENELAVAWADQGRSIVWQNILGLRTPLDDLRVQYLTGHPPTLGSNLTSVQL